MLIKGSSENTTTALATLVSRGLWENQQWLRLDHRMRFCIGRKMNYFILRVVISLFHETAPPIIYALSAEPSRVVLNKFGIIYKPVFTGQVLHFRSHGNGT